MKLPKSGRKSIHQQGIYVLLFALLWSMFVIVSMEYYFISKDTDSSSLPHYPPNSNFLPAIKKLRSNNETDTKFHTVLEEVGQISSFLEEKKNRLFEEGLTTLHFHEQQQQQPSNSNSNNNNLNSDSNNTVIEEPAPSPPLFEKIIDMKTGQVHDPAFVSQMLDFAIIGFAKTGTTALMSFLNSDSVWVPQREICTETLAPLLRIIYDETFSANNSNNSSNSRSSISKRGIKCPVTMEDNLHMKYFAEFLPNTKLIIGIRHPIRWFESFFNYRLEEMGRLEPPEKYMGRCKPHRIHFCSDRGKYADHLSRLGKTEMSTEDELSYFKLDYIDRSTYHPQQVFIYDLDQLADRNETRIALFRKDLASFLDIGGDEKLLSSPLAQVRPNDTNELIKRTQRLRKNRIRQGKVVKVKGKNFVTEPINICDPLYKELRLQLLQDAKLSSRWILEYFLKSSDVHTSSPYFFRQILASWNNDPCIVV